jgi:carbon storage regulator
MLVLSRKVGECIRIGDDVVITIQEMRGGRVRLAIEAPRNVVVLREELAPRPEKGSCHGGFPTCRCGMSAQ